MKQYKWTGRKSEQPFRKGYQLIISEISTSIFRLSKTKISRNLRKQMISIASENIGRDVDLRIILCNSEALNSIFICKLNQKTSKMLTYFVELGFLFVLSGYLQMIMERAFIFFSIGWTGCWVLLFVFCRVSLISCLIWYLNVLSLPSIIA